MQREVQLIVSAVLGGGADMAKALALGADAIAIGAAALIALGDNHAKYHAQYRQLGSVAGYLDDHQDSPRPGRHLHPGRGAPRPAWTPSRPVTGRRTTSV